ncbi:hypothetical protein FCT18_18230 [Lysinibacillus sphaericus]|uniref:Uncharacterized protein n=2 Tax=Lysinibacillus sphaericus TaxID=1421 RepID=A0A2S0K530_LYSSH|nr:hypothetical protein [Lysinibacillus sphaericus]AVK98485.1 hypothetical protein LS41612_20280 [Lysinibacillus sphaericus]MED4544013.1 hypothetical protein [Lysinibacillus sphaericus]TKI17431.1 hypothetical protein FCT18_18230 [Lysinibacillus sphaericus]GEC82321.1 hypothetical protein LSP03_20640 [Lysinibacillus sphaericus]
MAAEGYVLINIHLTSVVKCIIVKLFKRMEDLTIMKFSRLITGFLLVLSVFLSSSLITSAQELNNNDEVDLNSIDTEKFTVITNQLVDTYALDGLHSMYVELRYDTYQGNPIVRTTFYNSKMYRGVLSYLGQSGGLYEYGGTVTECKYNICN